MRLGTTSPIVLGLGGAGAFFGVLLAMALFGFLALGGLPKPYETAGMGDGFATAMHDTKAFAHRIRGGVCRRLPSVARDVLPCPAPAKARAHVRHRETAAPAHRSPHRATPHRRSPKRK